MCVCEGTALWVAMEIWMETIASSSNRQCMLTARRAMTIM